MKNWSCQTFSLIALLAVLGNCGEPADTESEESSSPNAGLDSGSGVEAQVPVSEEDIPAVVARIGELEITREAYLKEIRTREKQLEAELNVLRESTKQPVAQQPLTAQTRQQILGSVVSKELLRILAEEKGYTATEAEIEERLAKGRDNLEAEDTYRTYLEWYGLTEEELRGQIRDQIIADRYINENIPPCDITEDDIRTVYDQLLADDKLQGPADVDFWHVLLMVGPGSPPEVWDGRKAEAVAIRERIVAGEDIEVLAKELSEDPTAERNSGLYEYIEAGMMVPTMDTYIFSGEIGELSEPIKTVYGWHIVKVKQRREEGIRSYEKLEGRLRDSLEKNCQVQRARDFIEEKMDERQVQILYQVPGAEA